MIVLIVCICPSEILGVFLQEPRTCYGEGSERCRESCEPANGLEDLSCAKDARDAMLGSHMARGDPEFEQIRTLLTPRIEVAFLKCFLIAFLSPDLKTQPRRELTYQTCYPETIMAWL